MVVVLGVCGKLGVSDVGYVVVGGIVMGGEVVVVLSCVVDGLVGVDFVVVFFVGGVGVISYDSGFFDVVGELGVFVFVFVFVVGGRIVGMGGMSFFGGVFGLVLNIWVNLFRLLVLLFMSFWGCVDGFVLE